MSERDDDQHDREDKPTQRLRREEGHIRRPQDTRRLDPPAEQQAPETGYATTLICSECDGQMVWARTALITNPYRLGAVKWNTEDAWSLHATELWALVCSNCGFTKFYARDPRKLLE